MTTLGIDFAGKRSNEQGPRGQSITLVCFVGQITFELDEIVQVLYTPILLGFPLFRLSRISLERCAGKAEKNQCQGDT